MHVPTQQEVNVYFDQYDPKAPWRILYNLNDVPEKDLLRQALILGFELRAAEISTNPSKYLFSLSRNCVGDHCRGDQRAATYPAFDRCRFNGLDMEHLL